MTDTARKLSEMSERERAAYDLGKMVGWDAAKRDTSKSLGLDGSEPLQAGYAIFEGKPMKVLNGDRLGWWRFHDHYDRQGYCDNPARGY